MEFRIVQKNGQPIHLSYGLPPLRDEAVARAGCLWLDWQYPGLGPHRIQARTYRDNDWEQA